MKKIGITGGIGVGKTYVAEIFQKLGIPVFNADIEAKRCLTEDTKLMIDVRSIFGKHVYLNGVLQKEELAKIVFNNKKRLLELSALVHPVVKQRFEDWCNIQTTEIVMKEAAILFESDAHIGLDAVICISANDQLRIKRIKKREGCSDAEIKNRIRNQIPQSKKEELSDFIIVNNEDELLVPQLIELLKEIE